MRNWDLVTRTVRKPNGCVYLSSKTSLFTVADSVTCISKMPHFIFTFQAHSRHPALFPSASLLFQPSMYPKDKLNGGTKCACNLFGKLRYMPPLQKHSLWDPQHMPHILMFAVFMQDFLLARSYPWSQSPIFCLLEILFILLIWASFVPHFHSASFVPHLQVYLCSFED